MNIFELIIDEEAEVFGIEAISLVEQPAIQSDWIAMKSHDVKFKTQDESKRIVMGAALIPDKPIYRSQDGKEFYVYFSKKTVRRTGQESGAWFGCSRRDLDGQHEDRERQAMERIHFHGESESVQHRRVFFKPI